ncbi:39S ribosomal protein L45, mitochondrial isoform X2 [Brachypodium distachyon]|uniref:39S ribosomal protein L45, mitochondrial isoform X2 n=1 Tax=Brachypodium distachyon TaxID=15368 RepID=UPI00052FFAF8|nr:39S ribosomal protein L45, mitochondrial isoform X2 [Brachypodium distachyon]|eukprot:XP_010234696.1 39S ribosomal protein L45, mitochondrial isoform X2 [Brachypodium distachyon]
MSLARLGQSLIRRLHRPLHLPPPPPTDHHAAVSRSLALSQANRCLRGFASLTYNPGSTIAGKFGGPSPVHAVQVLERVVQLNHARPMSSAAPAPAGSTSSGPPETSPSVSKGVPVGARKVGMKVVMMSPGFVYEPYSLPEPISFWRRWFTRSGWTRTKEDIILEMKNAYAVSRLRKKTGYTKKQFYNQAFNIYKEVNTLMAQGDTSSLRKALTERMHSTMKNEIKRRQSKWKSVHWELVEPAVNIRTLRARMIGLDKNDLDKAFIQLTLEFITKQKFEAYNSKGEVVSGDKSKEVLVKDIWVFERSLFHPGADWRVCGRITL